MRFSTAIVAALIGASLCACGAGRETSKSTTGAKASGSAEAGTASNAVKSTAAHASSPHLKLKLSKREIAKLPKLTVAKRNGPRPKHLVVRDLRKGTGVRITKKDAMVVDFYDVKYRAARVKSHTGHYGPTTFGMRDVIKGWALGLPGMRVGGRRELIVPPKLGYRGMTLIYVIDLLAVKKGGAGPV